mmetsp:Transcript_99350/g.281356  ORF Transcript_99350/g.281356 Transcript_99350/m.281356 type:complete len:510 (-) Transcript_99350:339-1868(-)
MAHMSPLDMTGESTVLDSRNGAEESMMSFIRHHVAEIIRPVMEHVNEVEQKVAHISKDNALTDTKVDEHKLTLDKINEQLLAIRNNNNTLTSWMNRTQAQLQKEAEVRERVESDVDSTKSAIAKASERQQHCMAQVESLDRKFGSLNSNFMCLKDLVAKAEGNLEAHAKNLGLLQDQHDDLTANHKAAAAKLQQASELGEATVRDLQRLMAAHQHHCEETGVCIEDINDHLMKVHKTMDATVDLTDKDRAELRQTADFVKSMRQNLSHKDGVCYRIDGMQAREDEIYNALKKHLEAFEHLQRLVESLSGGTLGTGGDGGSQPRGMNSDLLEELRAKLDAHDLTIEKMGTTQGKHVESIKDAVMAIEKLQRDSQRIKEFANGTQNELSGLVTAHKQANNRMESHTIDHSRLASDMQLIGKEVDTGFKQVKGDVGSTSAAVAKLRSHFDAANTNLYGLAKGFQDAGRHTVGAEGKSGTRSPSSLRPLSVLRTPRGPTVPAHDLDLPQSPLA